jgi:hypothetical protein
LIGILGLFFLTASSAWAGDKSIHQSGFLDAATYGKLEKIEIRKGVTGYRWVGPRLNFSNYKKVLIEPVVLYPKPEPSEQVSEETLGKVADYVTLKLVDKIGAVLQLSFDPGPDVIRIQSAITGVQVSTEGMKAREIVPVAALFGGVQALTGTRNQDVIVFFEAKFLDSVSGDLLGAAIREVTGKQLEGKRDKLEMKDLEEALDNASSDGQAVLKGMIEAE